MLGSVHSDLVLAMVMAQTIFILQGCLGREMWSDHRSTHWWYEIVMGSWVPCTSGSCVSGTVARSLFFYQ
ncbi:TPA: hypothetical protein ACH3X1_013791 [Trebouxia sp. C0004]